MPWISAKSLKEFEVLDANDRLTDDGAAVGTIVPGGTVLFVVRGMSLANEFRVGITGRPVAFNQDLRGLIPSKGIDGRYLARFLEATGRRILTLVDEASHGTKRLTSDRLGALEVPIPPFSEQRRIAELLDRADALRAKRQTAYDVLDALPASIFIDMFGDPIVNSRGWPWRKLGDVGSLERGISKHRPRNAPELLGGPHPLVQTGDVANSDGYIRSHSSSYSDVGLHQSKMWPAGTLCITIAANIAKTGILTFDACFPDSVVGFRSESPATIEYVRIWLSFLQKTLEESAPESAQKNINLSILRSLDIPLPPIHLQDTFARRLKQVERLRATHHASLAELDALFASLQHLAFRGEL